MEKKIVNEVVKQTKAGFTLIEILVVVAIIGMLGAVAVPAYMNYLADARIETTRALIKSVDDALKIYNMKHGGKYPTQLSVLTESDGDEDPIIEGDLADPWGNELQYETRGKRRPLLTSAGPDGEFGTEDDLTNVKKSK